MQNLLQNDDIISVRDTRLFSHQKELDISLQNLRDQLEGRQRQIKLLIDQEAALCQTLGEKTKSLCSDPLPSARDIDDFKFYLTELENEKHSRAETFVLFRSKIQKLVDELEIEARDYRLRYYL